MRRLSAILSFLAIFLACLAFVLMTVPVQASNDDDDSPGLRENLLPAQQGDAKAAEWYGKAAQQGNPEAQTQLGNMYRVGKGVPQNYVLAYMWLDLASQQGSRQAIALKKNVSGKMTGTQMREAKQFLKNWKAKK